MTRARSLFSWLKLTFCVAIWQIKWSNLGGLIIFFVLAKINCLRVELGVELMTARKSTVPYRPGHFSEQSTIGLYC